VKIAVMEGDSLIHARYERHMSQVRQKTLELLKEAASVLRGRSVRVAISGSAGMGLAKAADLPFVQEVFATYALVRREDPDTDIVIELGGEDAKIIYFKGGIDERMNGTCAGGTGAFIDQMATLLHVTPDELDRLSLEHKTVYPIASRCGVFAKTDIQPLLNQGVSKADLAASIYYSVVNQTIAGLAQGRKLEGRIMFLGGPLHYDIGLRRAFVDTLKLSPENAVFPEDALYSVAKGAAIYSEAGDPIPYEDVVSAVEKTVGKETLLANLPPLFASREEFLAFEERHAKSTLPKKDPASYRGDAYLGIDCGSTTTKLVLISEEEELLWSYYSSNRGNPVDVVRQQLCTLYDEILGDRIRFAAVWQRATARSFAATPSIWTAAWWRPWRI
jgi:activator of 2-hydroxyglutaryl-CoA dehydratase